MTITLSAKSNEYYTRYNFEASANISGNSEKFQEILNFWKIYGPICVLSECDKGIKIRNSETK